MLLQPAYFDYGWGEKDPIESVHFYNKHNINQILPPKERVIHFLNYVFVCRCYIVCCYFEQT